MSQREKFVYFLAALNRSMVKIGYTASVQSRFQTYKTHSPVPIELLAIVSGSIADEWRIQAYYKARLAHGEWFYSTPQMLADIAEMNRTNAVLPKFDGPDPLKSPTIKPASAATRAKHSERQKARWARHRAAK